MSETNLTFSYHFLFAACYGIVSVPHGPWYCRKCETTERSVRVRCELCPSKEGALKRTDSNSWAHVVCALYIPEVRFGNVSTMEPIVLGLVPQERYLKVRSRGRHCAGLFSQRPYFLSFADMLPLRISRAREQGLHRCLHAVQ